MIKIFKLGGVEISEGELSALFRSEDHKNYKECGDKYIRVFKGVNRILQKLNLELRNGYGDKR